MKVCVYGAGAIGGFIGAQLAAAGTEVSMVARGDTLTALQTLGLRLQLKDRLVTVPVHASGDPTALGVQNVVVIAVKASSLAEVARRVAPLMAPKLSCSRR